MPTSNASQSTIKPSNKAIQGYYAALQSFKGLNVSHETGLRTAFQNLLTETARTQRWTLVTEQTLKVGGKSIRPDGVMRDEYNFRRGYWEAKDTDDNLDAEIRKKSVKGYPLTNIIFEDTKQAVLYRDGEEYLRVDLTNPQHVADLLNQFYDYTEPPIEGFEQAVAEFQERVPELAQGLDDKIKQAHTDNPKFQSAYAAFFELCKTALNPNISQAAVDEMLVQHLLTERLIRKIFNNADFMNNNIIAVEIEKVIHALVSPSFSREENLKSLDRFYRAIEGAALGLEDFKEKQDFLNALYERFFQGYDPNVADTHGIVYTPQPIVDFMCASIIEVLQTEFGKSLGDPDVVILDPCTGTGNFIVNLLRRASKRDLPELYANRLFANEIMLLPYYIAALNIEHTYYEQMGKPEAFAGLCFVDTLSLQDSFQPQLTDLFTEENTKRVNRQKAALVKVIVGNPPYNMGQQNENDNNKNRAYSGKTGIDTRIRETYAQDSNATLNTKLYDPYVKFFRWAVDRLQKRDGIVCYVSNNSFVDQIAFDGMRKHLLEDFTHIYHIDLHGNVRQNPKLSGTTHNVFGIQVGVGITLAVRSAKHTERHVYYYRVPEDWRKEEKYHWLNQKETTSGVEWQLLVPDNRYTWLVPENSDQFAAFLPVGSKETRRTNSISTDVLFKKYSLGVNTARDSVVYGFNRIALSERIEQFCDQYNAEVDRYKRKGKGKNVDDFISYSEIKWSRNLKRWLQRGKYLEFRPEFLRLALYRPFTKQSLYFADIATDELGQFPKFFPTPEAEKDNYAIIASTIGYRADTFNCFVSNTIVDLHVCASVDGHQCFPFYTYDEDGSNRRENITDWALKQFRNHYGNKSITKWDIFYYVYGVLHHPGYREKFADNLKRDLPRIPFAPEFRPFAKAGKALADLHLNYEEKKPYKLKGIEAKDVPFSYRVEKMRLSKDKTQLVVNDSLTLAGIPPEAFEYRLGNRSALDWVIDQYQVSTDKRSGITSDPNRADDQEYIVNLVGRVVAVSVETVKIVMGLPGKFTDSE